METKKATSLRNFIIAIVLATALLAAGTLWVLLGWRGALDVTLTDLAGDPAALRGFTMRGQSCLDTAHTYWEMHDGYLDTSFALDPDASDNQYRYSAWSAASMTLYAVAPEARDAVNVAAQRVQTYQDSWRMQSVVSSFRVMAEIDMDGGILRVALRDVTLGEPIAVSAYDEVPSYMNRTGYQYDYEADNPEPLRDESLDYSFIAGDVFALGAGQGLAWQHTTGGRKAGLYRATPISYDELAALPTDGKVGGRDVLCATTEYGTLEPFYCPEDARLVSCGLPMNGGLTMCVYLNKDGMACADLVDAAGVRVDHTDLADFSGDTEFYAAAYPRITDRDAVLHIYGDEITGYLTALRVQDGKFILNQSLPMAGNITLRNAEDAVLNTAGDALLIAAPEYTTVGETNPNNPYNTYQTGTLLLVCPLDGSTPRYRGRLNTGAERDWGSQLGGGGRSFPIRRYMSYEIYEKDRERRL